MAPALEEDTELERYQNSFPSWFSPLLASRVLLLWWAWERRMEPQAPRAVTAGLADRAGTDQQGWDRADLVSSSVLSAGSLPRVGHSYQCLSLDQPRRFQEDSSPRGTTLSLSARHGRWRM